MTIYDVYELLPLTEKTLRKRIAQNQLPAILANDGVHSSEYFIKNRAGVDCGMVKYFKGRLLAVYSLSGVSVSI